jgi:hypothetical protein
MVITLWLPNNRSMTIAIPRLLAYGISVLSFSTRPHVRTMLPDSPTFYTLLRAYPNRLAQWLLSRLPVP